MCGKDNEYGDNVNSENNDHDICGMGKENFGPRFGNINDVVPCIRMSFDSLDEGERFYKDYGRSVAFEIIIRTTHKNLRSDQILSRLYICRNGGRLGLKSVDAEDGDK